MPGVRGQLVQQRARVQRVAARARLQAVHGTRSGGPRSPRPAPAARRAVNGCRAIRRPSLEAAFDQSPRAKRARVLAGRDHDQHAVGDRVGARRTAARAGTTRRPSGRRRSPATIGRSSPRAPMQVQQPARRRRCGRRSSAGARRRGRSSCSSTPADARSASRIPRRRWRAAPVTSSSGARKRSISAWPCTMRRAARASTTREPPSRACASSDSSALELLVVADEDRQRSGAHLRPRPPWLWPDCTHIPSYASSGYGWGFPCQ